VPVPRPVARARDILKYRELLGALVSKDFQNRYAGSALGVLWTQLYPLLLLGVYSLVFTKVFSNDIPRFPLFVFIGIVVWNFFGTSIQLATNSILANSHLVLKMAFPRQLLTVSVVSMAFVDLAMSHVIVLAGAVFYGVPPRLTWLAIVPLIVLLAFFCTGLGLILASIAVYLRDIRFFVEVSMMLLMFVSGVFYDATRLAPSVRWMLNANPLAQAIVAYRQAFLDGVWPAASVWVMLGSLAVVAMWLGLWVFDQAEGGFADAF